MKLKAVTRSGIEEIVESENENEIKFLTERGWEIVEEEKTVVQKPKAVKKPKAKTKTKSKDES